MKTFILLSLCQFAKVGVYLDFVHFITNHILALLQPRLYYHPVYASGGGGRRSRIEEGRASEKVT